MEMITDCIVPSFSQINMLWSINVRWNYEHKKRCSFSVWTLILDSILSLKMRRSVCNLAVRSAERSLISECRASFTTSFSASSSSFSSSSSSSLSARALASELSLKQSRGSAKKECKVHKTSAESALQKRRLSFLSGIFAFLNYLIRGRASNLWRTDV